MAASFSVPSEDGCGVAGCSCSRKRSASSDVDDNVSRRQRRRKSLKPRQTRRVAMSTVPSETSSQMLPPTQLQQQMQPQTPHQQQTQPQTPHQQQTQPQTPHQQQMQQQSQVPLCPPKGTMVTVDTAHAEADKSKKLLEWELSKLGAEDMRSHAWYHGDRVDRNEAERLLRQCVAEEYGILNANGEAISPKKGQEDDDDLGSDGLEDVSSVSSEGDFALEDFLDGLADESGNVPDPFTATTTVKAAALLLQQRHRLDGVLSSKRPKRPKRNRRHFYCFLVRDSTNVRPPGRYVVSCLRVDKYDNENNDKNKPQNQASHIGDEQKQKKFLRRQLQRRQRRQKRRPVLHFVINEIILQPGTVYERSQFTFGDTLPIMASTISSNAAINNNNGRQYQPGFDSVPHLIRYYVGGADDNAVLSYGGGNEGAMGINSLFPQLTNTEVRIRYPCNRRCPLTNIGSTDESTNQVIVPAVTDNKQIRQRIPGSLAESIKMPTIKPFVPVETLSTLQNPLHQWDASSPTKNTSHWKQLSSSFRSSSRRTPSATVTSATACKPIANTELTSTGLSSCSTLPRSLASSIDISKIPTHSLSSVPSLSTQSLSTTTLPHSFTAPRLPASRSSSTSIISNTSSRSTTSSSFSVAPSVVPHAPASDLIIATSTGELSLAQRSSITVSLKNQPPKIKEPSPLKKLRIPDKSLQFHDIPDIYKQSSSSMHGSNASKFEGSRIDMDAEIAAALSAVGDDCDTALNDMFDDPLPGAVRSSFAHVNIGNRRRGRLGSNLSESGSHRSRTEDRQSRFDNYIEMSQMNNNTPSGHTNICNNQSTGYPLNNNYESNYHQLERPPLLPFPKNLSSLLDSPSLMPPPPPPLPKDSGMKFMGNKQNYEQFNFKNEDDYKLRNHQPQKIGLAGRKLDFGNTMGIDSFFNDGEESALQRHLNRNETHRFGASRTRGNREPTLKEWADMEIERLVCAGKMDPDQDSDVEEVAKLQEPTENEDFEVWRSRWSNSMQKRFVGTPEQRRKDRLNRRRTRLMEGRHNELRQRGLFFENPVSAERDLTNKGLSETGFSERLAAMKQGSVDFSVQDRMIAETLASGSSIRSTNNDGMVEKMINRWTGVPQAGKSIRNIRTSTVTRKANDEINIMHQQTLTQRKGCKKSSGEYQSSLEDDYLPTEKYLHGTQVNQMSNVNIGDTTKVIGTCKSSTTATFVSIANTDTDAIRPKIESGSTESDTVRHKPFGDYENIDLSKDNFQNNNNNMNNDYDNDANVDEIISYNDKKYCSSLEDSNSSNSSQDIIAAEGADYANIASRVTDNNKEIDYENVGKDIKKLRDQEKRQKVISDGSGEDAPVATALRAVHLAIIGDPKDGDKTSSVAGTGRLAAALCNADGRATVLPYRNCVESEREDNSMGSCPLQFLGHPGPEGRRARLDVIERFACLQYLVAMTVIVTPCLLLIGNNTKNPADKHLEWSLEDEYEYRRRKFYYRCAGIGDWYFSGSDSDSDDDDYQLLADSDFDSGCMLPPKEEWAIEKRHWLDLLTEHRAIALDKWIRTAADTKQAVGDVYGYRALMSALCSDRIQALRDAWATLRRLHTATAVAFESRLRPEFLGRRDKHLSASGGETAHDFNEDNDNDVDVLLQLPPNATVPDATALAVLYEHMYNDADYGANFSIANANDNSSKEDKNPRPSSLFTSPLLLSPSPWSSSNSGISSGLGASVTADYGLQALHVLCVQYSQWVQQNFTKKSCTVSYTKSSPMLQLDRFRNNFQTLLRQYGGSGYDDNYQDDYDDHYVHGYSQDKENIVFSKNEPSYNRDDTFEYERHYEDKVEEYGAFGGDYDDCGEDDDDDDATVICCSNSSSMAINVVNVSNNIITDTTDTVSETVAEKEPRQSTTKDYDHDFPRRGERDREECRWIKASGAYGPAPLNIVFRTELHVRLFWPPTLFLMDDNADGRDNDENAIDHQLAVPAYALGTTYLASETTAHRGTDKEHGPQHGVRSPNTLDQVITEQLNRAARDMRLRYKAMDKFLDGACAYSKLAAKLVNADMSTIGNQQQRGLHPK